MLPLLVPVLLLVAWAGFLAMVVWVFTTTVFAVEFNSGIWWFAIVLVSTLGLAVVWLALGHGHWRVSIALLTAVFALAGVSVWLGLKHQPFNLANIQFKLGALLGLEGNFQDIQYTDLPEARSEVSYRSLLPPAEDQGVCGNCWAMAAAAMLSTRVNKRNQAAALAETKKTSCLSSRQDLRWWHVSPQFITELDSVRGNSGKCDGAPVSQGLTLVSQIAAPPATCVPLYVQDSARACNTGCGAPVSYSRLTGREQCIHDGISPYQYSKCADQTEVSAQTRVGAKNIRKVRGEAAMKAEISANGPIVCVLNFYTKPNGAQAAWTLSSTGGTYAKFTSDGFVSQPAMDGNDYTLAAPGGYHLVTVYGYGTRADGVKYWEFLNSWGDKWGFNGSSKIERGSNAWNIEEYCYTAELA